jgi:DNA-binding transcriptional LysR family regulator
MFLALPCLKGMLASLMELRHLRYFAAVGEAQNVSVAARKLHLSQPALSRQVHDLEEELGFALLERSAKSVRLTEAGRTFLQETNAILQRVEEGVRAARAVAVGTTGELHVGYAPSLTVEILPRALRRFRKEFPRCKVLLHDLSTEEMLRRLREEKLHVALTVPHTAGKLRGLEFHELARYALCVAVSRDHRLARARGVSLASLAREPLIIYDRTDYPEYHAVLEGFFPAPRPPLTIAEECDSVTSLIAAVEAGRGVALVPSALACLAGPRLKLVPIKPAPAPIVVGALRKSGAPSPAVRSFIAAAEAE